MFSCSHYHGVVPAESTIKLKVKIELFICVDWVKIGWKCSVRKQQTWCTTGFCPKVMSEEGEQEMNLYPELGSDTSSASNFCAYSSDIISSGSSGGILKYPCLILHLIDDFPNISIYFLIFSFHRCVLLLKILACSLWIIWTLWLLELRTALSSSALEWGKVIKSL